MKLSDINLREKEFHNRLHEGGKFRKENIFYKAIYNLYEDFYSYIDENSKDKIKLQCILIVDLHD